MLPVEHERPVPVTHEEEELRLVERCLQGPVTGRQGAPRPKSIYAVAQAQRKPGRSIDILSNESMHILAPCDAYFTLHLRMCRVIDDERATSERQDQVRAIPGNRISKQELGSAVQVRVCERSSWSMIRR